MITEKERLGRLYPISICEYCEKWAELFEKEKEILNKLLGKDRALRIEHMGSTAVPGLAAKPTVDILVEIPEEETTREQIIIVLKNAGYIYMNERKDHIMFVKGYSPEGLEKESYHIHMGTREQSGLWERLLFRDYLREHKEDAREYEILKRKLADECRYDREEYTNRKSDFIKRITELARRQSKGTQ